MSISMTNSETFKYFLLHRNACSHFALNFVAGSYQKEWLSLTYKFFLFQHYWFLYSVLFVGNCTLNKFIIYCIYYLYALLPLLPFTIYTLFLSHLPSPCDDFSSMYMIFHHVVAFFPTRCLPLNF